MRRIYSKNGSKGLQEKALNQLRETREKISADHPDLMDELRLQIEKITGSFENIDHTKIDRQKNLDTVAKFMQISSGNSEWFQAQLREILKQAH